MILINRRTSMWGGDEHDFAQDYLTFEAINTGTFSLTIPANVGTSRLTSVSYSTDNGTTWTTTNNTNSSVTITTPQIQAGNKVMWKGIGDSYSSTSADSYNTFNSSHFSRFQSTGTFKVYGNMMSMLSGDSFRTNTVVNGTMAFTFMFYQCKITSAKNLVFGATTLSRKTFAFLFAGCTSLVETPRLFTYTDVQGGPWCARHMFSGCTSLVDASKLSLSKTVLTAATLNGQVSGIYYGMFQGCTNLEYPPKLPATTLSPDCYENMFINCRKMKTAPDLKAGKLENFSYKQMFSGCTALNHIKMIATNISASSCLANWVVGVSSSGTFIKHPNTNLNTGTSGIPSGWSVETESS